VLKNAPHKEAAVKFLEYLASDEAQRYFADGNNEWPVVPGIKVANPALAGPRQVQGRHPAGGLAGHVPRQGTGHFRSRGYR
jgi:ABC-type glycerol-3-phosphate transport system substrate-binding protein